MSQNSTLLHSTSGPPAEGARARKRADTRERLFEAALKEFREFGFAGAQIDRIAKSANVVRGTFYFHFPSKDDVLIELARRIHGRVARRLAILAGSSTSLRELLRRVVDANADEHTRVGEAGLEAELVSLYMRRPHDVNVPADLNVPTLVTELEAHFETIEMRSGKQMSIARDLAAVVFITSLFGIYVRIPPGENRRIACDALIELFVGGLESGSSKELSPSSESGT